MSYFTYMAGVKFRNAITEIKVFDIRRFIAHLFGRRIIPADLPRIFYETPEEDIIDAFMAEEIHLNNTLSWASGKRKELLERRMSFIRKLRLALIDINK